MPPIDSPAALAGAIEALARIDPEAVSRLLATAGPPRLRLRPAGFEGLARIVVAQQVSTASAAAIFARLVLALAPFEPATLADLTDAALKGCGLSIQKIRTLRALAAAIEADRLPLTRLTAMPADDAMAALVAVPGIGPWTAEVFLLFCLGHADAWPEGDLALREAVRILLGLDHRPSASAMRVIGARWRPLRGAAAYLLWAYYRAVKSRDGAPPGEDPA